MKMNRTLRIGLALVLIGLGLVIGVSVVTKGEYFSINEDEFTYYEEIYTSEEFDSFDFDFDNRKVYVLPSEDDSVKVEFYLNEKEEFELNDEGTTLEITIDRKWYNNFFNIGNLTNPSFYDVYLYLPDSQTAFNLNILSSNGKISVSNTDDLGVVYLDTSNGDILIDELNAAMLDLETSNGRIELENVVVTGDIYAGTSNGRIILDQVQGDTLTFSTSNGKIEAENITALNLKLSSSNGDIEAKVFGNQDDFRIKLATSNGSRYLDGIKVDQSDFNNNQANYVDIRSSNGTVSLDFITD